MRAHVALLWLVALACTAACSADFGANPSTRCDETTLCPLAEVCYRGFCVHGHEQPGELDGSLSPITAVEAGTTPGLAGGGEAGTAAPLGDAQSPGTSVPVGDGGASAVTNDAGPSTVAPAAPEDAAAPVSPATPPTTTPGPTSPAVDPTPGTAPTTPAPTTPAPTTPTTPVPTTPEPTTPVTPTPVIDAGAPEASVPPPAAEPEQSSPLLLCLAVCLTRSSLCVACLVGSINNDPTVCDERQVRGDRELRELCDWLCASGDCRGAR